MKNIPEERLSTIGKLIEVTREEKRNKSQNKYTMKSFVEGICTVNTLKRIEAGEIARIEDVYVELLDKLNLKLGYFPAVDDAILELMDPLYEAIEYYRVEDISKYCDMGLRVLGKVKNYVYYSELYELLMATKRFYLDVEVISLQKMELFLRIYPLMNSKFQLLFKVMIFYRVKREASNNPKLFDTVVKELNLANTSNVIEEFLYLNYYIVFNNNIALKDNADRLEKQLIETRNYVRLLDVYFCVLYVLIGIDNQEVEVYMRKAEKIIKNNDLPRVKVIDYYCNLAGTLHEKQLYEEALMFYLKMVEIADKSELLLSALICMAHCQRVLGLDVDIPLLEDHFLKNSNKLIQKAYRYFTSKDVEAFAKINYIIKELAPCLNFDVLIEIFRDEISILIKETGSYKSLYIYNRIVKDNLEQWNDDFVRKSE
ncbi:hypothetical protein Aargi30884_24120 [Amedibacterium intestinale]|uniref:HTH cro/C1-type domain-containing protein n=2 Tax=Amedibacterium intestinale TaxID=2583452 RepID=A0A6N4TL71_9FIRM|nr:hypothetical protein [Amedibacterium intestinale]BBK23509.1 hypothetical protein Aargi30884_24120 [Amedibacterium intestinale]